MVSYKIEVEGRVQGVGFRFFVFRAAKDLNIKGFVQNILERKVLIEATGEENHMNNFIAECRRGPTPARVLDFKLSQIPLKNFDGFEIKKY